MYYFLCNFVSVKTKYRARLLPFINSRGMFFQTFDFFFCIIQYYLFNILAYCVACNVKAIHLLIIVYFILKNNNYLFSKNLKTILVFAYAVSLCNLLCGLKVNFYNVAIFFPKSKFFPVWFYWNYQQKVGRIFKICIWIKMAIFQCISRLFDVLCS